MFNERDKISVTRRHDINIQPKDEHDLKRTSKTSDHELVN